MAYIYEDMVYEPKEWKGKGEDGAIPLNPANLNRMEDGITIALSQLEDLQKKINGLVSGGEVIWENEKPTESFTGSRMTAGYLENNFGKILSEYVRFSVLIKGSATTNDYYEYTITNKGVNIYMGADNHNYYSSITGRYVCITDEYIEFSSGLYRGWSSGYDKYGIPVRIIGYKI